MFGLWFIFIFFPIIQYLAESILLWKQFIDAVTAEHLWRLDDQSEINVFIILIFWLIYQVIRLKIQK